MTNYEKIKNVVEKIGLIDEKEYNRLVITYGKKVIDDFFELYISDQDVVDNDNKYKIIGYYCENIKDSDDSDLEEFIVDDSLNCADLNNLKIYLSEVSKFPLLTVEEEKELFLKLQDSKKYLDDNNVTIKSIDERLKKYDYKYGKFNSTDIMEIKKKCHFILNKCELDENDIDLIKLRDDLERYLEYRTVKDRIFSCNLRLVLKLCRRYRNNASDFMDLIQCGNFGLNTAIDRFDLSLGTKLSTYATCWIERELKCGTYFMNRSVYIPHNFSSLINRYHSIVNKYNLTNGDNPSDDEMVKLFRDDIRKNTTNGSTRSDEELDNICRETIKRIKELDKFNCISLHVHVSDDSDDELLNYISDDHASVEESIVNVEYIKNILSSLKIREKLTVILRYGLKIDLYMEFDEFCESINKRNNIIYTEEQLKRFYSEFSDRPFQMSLDSIGNLLGGLSKERIRQIQYSGENKIKSKNIKDWY